MNGFDSGFTDDEENDYQQALFRQNLARIIAENEQRMREREEGEAIQQAGLRHQDRANMDMFNADMDNNYARQQTEGVISQGNDRQALLRAILAAQQGSSIGQTGDARHGAFSSMMQDEGKLDTWDQVNKESPFWRTEPGTDMNSWWASQQGRMDRKYAPQGQAGPATANDLELGRRDAGYGLNIPADDPEMQRRGAMMRAAAQAQEQAEEQQANAMAARRSAEQIPPGFEAAMGGMDKSGMPYAYIHGTSPVGSVEAQVNDPETGLPTRFARYNPNDSTSMINQGGKLTTMGDLGEAPERQYIERLRREAAARAAAAAAPAGGGFF